MKEQKIIVVKKNGRSRSFVDVTCQCGNIVRRNVDNIGKNKHCRACFKPNLKHGRAKDGTFDLTYSSWENMKARCLNPNNPYFHKYGGAGVRICKTWLQFENFLRDMGERPSKLHTIDRIKNHKGYSFKNCRWATRKEQSRNRSCTVLYKFEGGLLNLTDISVRFGVTMPTVKYHLNQGKTLKEIAQFYKAKGTYLE